MMIYKINKSIFVFLLFAIGLTGCNNSPEVAKSECYDGEFIVESPRVSCPLPIVDNISNNCSEDEKRSIEDNPVAYILRGINDIWQGTTDAYQKSSSGNGPAPGDYVCGNPVIDSVIWRENIQYVLKVTQNRTQDEAILAFLDDVRSKYYSVIDGFGPLTEDFVKYSGANVDLPDITINQVLNDTHYQSEYNNGSKYAGSVSSPLGPVVKLAMDFRNTCASTEASKYLYSTPRPWRMNDSGAVIFKGTTYNTKTQKPTYSCIDYKGNKTLKIFDEYESNVKVIPGLMCSRKAHREIYDDNQPAYEDLYSNTTDNIRTDNGYPSGHTNAGALISLAYAYAFPERFAELIYRGSQLGENRIIAGMHSPVDVIGGKVMALAVACAALNKPDVGRNAEKSLSSTFNLFGAKADSVNMSLYEYARRKVDAPVGYSIGKDVNTQVFNNSFYDDKAQVKKIYRERLTYGFSRDTSKATEPPIVPKGAEVILESRFPYLTDNQRRLVLYTTELPSGYKILDKTNGWGRIDLISAADGFGSFIGDVHVKMDASLRRFNALDSWGNDISGDGRLIKSGTGKLVLTGNNSFSGGTVITDGILAAASNTALGNGDVYLRDDGMLEVNHFLDIQGSFFQDGGGISVRIGIGNTPQIKVNKSVVLKNSTLNIILNENIHPEPGDTFAIIQGDELSGNFDKVNVDGYPCVSKKTGNTIYVVLE